MEQEGYGGAWIYIKCTIQTYVIMSSFEEKYTINIHDKKWRENSMTKKI